MESMLQKFENNNSIKQYFGNYLFYYCIHFWENVQSSLIIFMEIINIY